MESLRLMAWRGEDHTHDDRTEEADEEWGKGEDEGGGGGW